MTMLNHRYANSGPFLPTPDVDGEVPFARAAVVATPNVVYVPPIAPAAADTVAAGGGRSALVQFTAPANQVAGQLLRLTPRFTMGFEVTPEAGEPPEFLLVDMSLQVRVDGGAWGLCVADPALPAEFNGITRIEGTRDAGGSGGLLWSANPGMHLAGEHLVEVPAGQLIEVRASWRNNPGGPNYLTMRSFTQTESETGGWHLECGLAYGPVVPAP